MAEEAATQLLKDKYNLSGVEAINQPIPGGQDERSALHAAANEGLTDDIRVLLQANADVDKQDECEATPLHLAALENKVEAAKMLLEANANPNAKDNSGATPLHNAACWGFCDVVKLLLDKGAQPSLQDEMEQTALDKALEYRLQDKPEVVTTVSLLKEAK